MSTYRILIYIFVMSGVTYLIRMLPMAIFKKKIESPFIKSFLFYVPYAVLGAMTLPEVLNSTASIWSALIGVLVAIFLAFKEKGLLIVALSACATVYIMEWILRATNLLA
ncbi:AzlD domain-containing protein [uncultured Clostridium sp.]|uniref:AzlD domain-containing protein n=1 Tax=uncultured Clostridium sp. TaxID=59620 RepID=UPI0028EB2C72|nr:AzlD domain-containing protein [uncultured Clostridium sp.]